MSIARPRKLHDQDRRFGLGILALVVVFGGYILSATGILTKPFAPGTRTIRATFANTADLHPGAPVRLHGVDVGKVSTVEKGPRARDSVVLMKVKTNTPRLRATATASLRWRLALGGTYQVELLPGDGPVQSRGETIDMGHTDSQAEVDEILTTLGAGQRAGIRSTLTELPQAFADRAAPAAALGEVADVTPKLAPVVRSVRGIDPGADLRRLVRSTARAVRAVDAPSEPINAVVEGGAATLQTTARRAADIQATIVAADTSLPHIRTSLTRLNTTLGIADPTLTSLLGPAGDVAPAAARLRPTVLAADALLAQARPLLARLRPAASALRAASRAALPLLNGLEPSLKRLDTRILPDLALVDKTSHRATYEMIGPTVAGFNAVAGQLDSTSHLVALDAASGDPKVDTSGCSTYFSDVRPGQLVNCEALMATIGKVLGISATRSGR